MDLSAAIPGGGGGGVTPDKCGQGPAFVNYVR